VWERGKKVGAQKEAAAKNKCEKGGETGVVDQGSEENAQPQENRRNGKKEER